ncbi:inositol-pentakisphosphate 2-kinase [Thamnocephalis sphaerospora]|uniref:Inositol-pentakisphosphate 2-kinase n=1 Tax=Thamnocephalis sphaerospora TaxID=78915 RepID=A0A4V1IX58_9FUNG|nr:inositol-pentakisphosphate 2-kinase [Thamnocephalis sphaerospora]|eukprot:RKP09909.1 inositol-pentakisphosphate 2-kinase [Thamnocephalis sphaerospora]
MSSSAAPAPAIPPTAAPLANVECADGNLCAEQFVLRLDTLNPEEWAYRAEGNANICFAYAGADSRLSARPSARWPDARDEQGQDVYDPTLELFYRNEIVTPLLGEEYVSRMRLVRLDTSFLLSLARAAEPLRPVERRTKEIDVDQPYGLLALDHAAFVATDAQAIALELKPKWGFLPDPSSPYVHAIHPAKLHTCRYCMHQHLKRKQKCETDANTAANDNTAGWAHSNYCPLDLFSGSLPRVRRALAALAQCPQNNMRIWVTPGPSTAASPHLLGASTRSGLLAMDDIRLAPFLDRFLDMAAEILVREDLLSRLRQHQRQLDEPGISTILRCYEQLREQSVHGVRKIRRIGSALPPRMPSTQKETVHVWRLMLENYRRRQATAVRFHATRSQSTSCMTRPAVASERAGALLDVPDLASTRQSTDLSDGSDRSDVSDNVNDLSLASSDRKQQRLLRLHEYLLAATLKDCTVLLTIGTATPKPTPVAGNHYLTEYVNACTFEAAPSVLVDVRSPDATAAGARHGCAAPLQVCYKMNVIDLDMKPAARIPHYYALDKRILAAYLESGEKRYCR